MVDGIGVATVPPATQCKVGKAVATVEVVRVAAASVGNSDATSGKVSALAHGTEAGVETRPILGAPN
jgi:hypothetical protein